MSHPVMYRGHGKDLCAQDWKLNVEVTVCISLNSGR